MVRSSRMVGACVVLVCLASFTLPNAADAATPGDSINYSLPVKAGWNLLSLPVDAAGATREATFPSAVSNAFVYDSGYSVADTLVRGRGFWLKFAAAETITVTGAPNGSASITLREGWNMIGGINDPAAVSETQTTPAGIVASKYFGFLPASGYQSTDTLWPGMGYWVKAGQGGTLIIEPAQCPSTLDYAGKNYNTVVIGDQCWMGENLDAGVMVPGADSQTDNGTIEKYCYDDDTSNCALFGALYQWDEAMGYVTTPGAGGICPPGWHIPALAEFDSLGAFVGNDGNALKMVGQGTGEGAGTNTSGFSALLAGSRGYYGNFFNAGYVGYFLSSTEYDGQTANYMSLAGSDGYYSTAQEYGKQSGFALRCLRD